MRRCFRWTNVKRLLSDVRNKIAQRKFAEVPSTIEDYFELHYWYEKENCTLIYEIGNSDMNVFKALLETRFNDDIQDSSRLTPTMNAIIDGNFSAARMLHHAHIHYLRNKELNEPITMRESFEFLKWRKLEIPVVRDLITKLKDKGWSSQQLGEVIGRVTEFQICDVVFFQDFVMTERYLQARHKYNNQYDFGSYRAFEIITPTLDLEHVKVILDNSSNRKIVVCKFCRYFITNIRFYHRSKSGRDFMKRIFSLDILDEDAFKGFEEALHKTEKLRSVEIFLQYNFHQVVKAKYSRDLLACIFGNRNIKVATLLENKQVNIDGRGLNGNTPLHFAAENKILSNIRMLLYEGADPNALNDKQETPLELILTKIYCFKQYQADYECVKLLLLSGANPFLIRNKRNSINSIYQSDPEWFSGYCMKIIKVLVAQSVVYEASGRPIDDSIKAHLDFYLYRWESFYMKCSEQLNELKAWKICDILNNPTRCNSEFSLLTLLAENPEKIARYFADEDLKLFDRFVHNNDGILKSHYKDLLSKHVKDIAQINRHRARAAQLICEFTGINDPRHLAIDKIVSYLRLEDVRKLSSTSTSNWVKRCTFEI